MRMRWKRSSLPLVWACRGGVRLWAVGAAASAERVLQTTTNMSKRDARRVTAVADGLAGLPNVAERLACGRLTLEHAASLVDAGAGLAPLAAAVAVSVVGEDVFDWLLR